MSLLVYDQLVKLWDKLESMPLLVYDQPVKLWD